VAVAIGAYVDGGPLSPLTLILFVTLGYVTLAYPPRAVLLFSVAAVAIYAGLAAASDIATVGPEVFLEACILALSGLLGTLSARNHWRSRNDLLEMTHRFERLAMADHVTACLNRRALWERLADDLARAECQQTVLSLLVVDVDRFKAINDSYGHLAGDKVLDQIGNSLLACVRAVDVVGRVGGDEFAVVLPGNGAAEANRVAQRILETVRALELLIPITVTVSVGLAEYPTHGSEIEALFEAADRSLYAAKGAGRDAVAAAVGPT
jgi:diguanylate cyclase (GGDEF)-like protein